MKRSRGGQVSERTHDSPLLHRRPQANTRGTSASRGQDLRQGVPEGFPLAFLLDRKERYRKAAGLPPSTKSTSGQRNSVPEAVYGEADRVTEATTHPTL